MSKFTKAIKDKDQQLLCLNCGRVHDPEESKFEGGYSVPQGVLDVYAVCINCNSTGNTLVYTKNINSKFVDINKIDQITEENYEA
jgi:hypothetical protein